jgi:class 3 adenylate cyclase
MLCDLVGSTALSEKLDPEELQSLSHAYRTLCGDVIARYDGFVARYVGDGILTDFRLAHARLAALRGGLRPCLTTAARDALG